VIAAVLGVSASRAASIAAEYPVGVYPSPAIAFSTLDNDASWACPALQMNRWTSRRVPTFAYEFNDDNTPARFVPQTDPPVAAHGSELGYIFDLPSAPFQAKSCQGPSMPLSGRVPMSSMVMPRADDQIPHGPGGQDLPGPGRGHDPRRDVHGDSPDVAVAELDLAGVQSGADLQADPLELLAERGHAAERPAGAVEGGQDAITGGLDQLPVELPDQPAGQLVVDLQQLPPAPVAEPGGPLG
jgi:hypothetical protein